MFREENQEKNQHGSILRHFERNLKSVLTHHQTERQKFQVTLRRSIVMPGGTPEQIGNYRKLRIKARYARQRGAVSFSGGAVVGARTI